MADLFDLARFRRTGSKEAARMQHPDEFDSPQEQDPITVRRGELRDELKDLEQEYNLVLQSLQLPMVNSPTAEFEQRMADLRWAWGEFDTYCPPTDRPYSPCAADSRASLAPEQWEHFTNLRANLQQLIADMAESLETIRQGF